MIEELSHVTAYFPKTKKIKKIKKAKGNGIHQASNEFDAYFRSLEQDEVNDEILSINYNHLITFQRQVNCYVESKMKERDHINSYRISLFFIDYDTEQVSESGIISDDVIRETNVMIDPVYPDYFKEDTENKEKRYSLREATRVFKDDMFRYKYSVPKQDFESLITEITEYRNECENCEVTSLKSTRNLIWELRGALTLKNEDIVNLVKILDEDIFERQHYPQLKIFIVMHAAMTYQYNINKPKVFVDKLYFYQSHEIMYQNLYVLLKNNVLPMPVFDLNFVKDLVTTRFTYPSYKDLEGHWMFLKRLHAIKIRSRLDKYYKNLYLQDVGDELMDEVRRHNDLYKLAVVTFKYLSQLLNNEENVFTDFFEYMVEDAPIKLTCMAKIKKKLNQDKEKDEDLDMKAFRQLVDIYVGKIYKKINKHDITTSPHVVEFFKNINDIRDRAMCSKKPKNIFEKQISSKENRQSKILNMTKMENPEVTDSLKCFHELAHGLIYDYFSFVQREFKMLYVAQYEVYDRIINPDICGSVINSIHNVTSTHSIHFIVKLFHLTLLDQKGKQPSYVIYDAFKKRLTANYPDYLNRPDDINKYFYYCHQLFIHIGVIAVSPQRPFYVEVMRV